MILYKYISLDLSLISLFRLEFELLLKDPDPVVMTCGLYILHDVISYNPHFFKRYLNPVLFICNQFIQRHIPNDYYYNGVPMPYTLILLIKVLGQFGIADKMASTSIYRTLFILYSFCDLDNYIGTAITYEWIRTVAKIYPNSLLLKKATQLLHKIQYVNNTNQQYIAVLSLSSMLKYHKEYAYEFRLNIAKYMREKDESIRTACLEILLNICTTSNLSFVMDNILQFFRTCYDVETRDRFIIPVVDMLDRYSDSPKYYIQTLTELLYYCGPKHSEQLINIIINLLKDGVGDDKLNIDLRIQALDIYSKIISEYNILSKYVAIVGLYIIGEYSYLLPLEINSYIQSIYNIFTSNYSSTLNKYCITALTKIYLRTNMSNKLMNDIIKSGIHNNDVDVCQRVKLLIGIKNNISQNMNYDYSFFNTDISNVFLYIVS